MLDSGSNMEMFQLIFGIILLVSVKFLLIRFIYERIRLSKLSKEDLKFDKIRSIYKDLKNEKPLTKKRIAKNANSLEKRTLVFEALDKFNKTELFPKELFTREKAAESYLANWLYDNEEYDNSPDYIELHENRKNELIIFKFKSDEPHIFANKGWLYGYVKYNTSTNEAYKEPNFIISYFQNSVLTLEDLEFN